MSLTTLHPHARRVTSSWHPTVATLPSERRAATPFHSPQWAAAWQSGALHTGLNRQVLRAWDTA
jgi:hypothetical protein